MLTDRIVPFGLALVLALAATAPPSLAAPAAAQDGLPDVETEYEGAPALGLALRRLGQTARVLHIAAHPDDENTALLSTLALGHGVDAAYLALTRGEGGQNGIGPELQEALGLLRSEELLAARRLDGAVQLFTRAYDFGYSKSAEEAFRHWPRDEVLGDVVDVIRRFRPDLVVSVFSGTSGDGHGQHQVAGILAREAVLAAADPARFPHRGAPHRTRGFYRSSWFRSQDGTHTLATGELDPLLGRSHHQIAMASRSRHRSQDMGTVAGPGPRRTGLIALDPATGERIESSDNGGSIFDEVPEGLTDRARDVASPAARSALPLLRRYEAAVATARAEFRPMEPGRLIEPLADARSALDEVLAVLGEDPAAAPLRFHVEAERADVGAALARAAGLVFRVVSDDARVVPGQIFELRLQLWNGGSSPIEVPVLEPSLPDGWAAGAFDDVPTLIGPGELIERAFTVVVPDDAEPTRPYYLERPRDGDLYAWPDRPDLRGLPFAPDPVRGLAKVRIAGVDLDLDRPARYIDADRNLGEFSLPVMVVPILSVQVTPRMAVLPPGPGMKPPIVTVRLTSGSPDTLPATVRLDLPAGWTSQPDAHRLVLAGPGDGTVEFRLDPPAAGLHGEHEIRAVARAHTGMRSDGPVDTGAAAAYDAGYEIIDYPHIRPHALYGPAITTLRAVDVRLAEGLRVGYVMGAGDGVPELLGQLGVPVTFIDEAMLAGGDLDVFDVIVTGIRAYEVRPDLVRLNDRLLRWVEEGGTLVVQYNKYEFAAGGFAPYPVHMARPHDRVTDEDAPVTLLDPEHPVLRWPNRIDDADFRGWVQERGLYFLHEWDDRYTPLLEMSDFGGDAVRGALLVAPHGAGTYVYTGLSFFRQLPAGVPGAVRLFANIISLGADA